ncbi:MAG: lipopolysaccharide biosynthesis protein [Armatimonadota bacterium]
MINEKTEPSKPDELPSTDIEEIMKINDTPPIDIGRAARQGGIWSFISHSVGKVIGFASSIVLARILMPEQFGMIAMVHTVLGLVQIIGVWGIGHAIMYERENHLDRANTGWWLELLIGIGLFIISNALAPVAVSYYDMPILRMLIFVASVNFIINPLGDMTGILLKRELKFKILTKIELAGSVVSSVSTIVFALLGAGVWSFIYPGILTSITMVIFKLRAHPFRPSVKIHWNHSKSLLGYGKFLFGTTLIGYINDNIGYILIGGLLGSKQLGLYLFAYNLGTWIVQNITGLIMGMLFPTIASIQNDHAKAQAIFLRVIQCISIVGFPIIALQLALADIYLVSIYGEKWLPCVIAFKLIAIYGMGKAVCQPTLYLISALGKPEISFKVSLAASPLLVAAIYLGSKGGINGVALATAIAHGAVIWLFLIVPFKALNWDVKCVFVTLAPAFYSSVFAGVMTALLYKIFNGANTSLTHFLILGFTGALIYVAAMYVFFKDTTINMFKLIRMSVREARE